jgi:hypothetical protein
MKPVGKDFGVCWGHIESIVGSPDREPPRRVCIGQKLAAAISWITKTLTVVSKCSREPCGSRLAGPANVADEPPDSCVHFAY